MSASAPTYKEAYAQLARIAAELENGEADLDRILPLLEEAKTAYTQCKERIEAVQAVLSDGWAPDEEPELEDDRETDASPFL